MDEYTAVKFVPEHLLAHRYECPRCRVQFMPNWLKTRGFPMGSIEAKGGYWVRLTAQERCPACEHLVEITLPVVKRRDVVLLFGDEAARLLTDIGGLLYTYSLIGTSKPFIGDIENDIRQLKLDLCPDLDPGEWKIHMTVIWSGQQRRKYREFRDWDKQKVDQLIGGVGEIIRGAGNKLFKYNIVLAGQPQNQEEKRKFEDYVQHEAYILLLVQVIDNITGLGGQPVIHFDAQKPTKANTVIHQWARDAFQHGQGNLLYSFLSHSIFVPEPVFVPPASHPLLEIADFMSFTVARHHYRVYNKAQPEIDLRVLGQVMYMTFSHDGDYLLCESSEGYPWQLDFPNQAS